MAYIGNRKIIAEWKGDEYYKDTTIKVYEPKADEVNGHHYFVIEEMDKRTTIEVRRVDRSDSAIQVTVEEYKYDKNRTKLLCFSLPEVLADLFIKTISKKQ